MAQAKALSLGHFTAAVQSAVKAAVKKHPKLQVPAPESITFSYLIRGFPLPDTLVANVSIAEAQAFADEIATTVAARPELAAASLPGGKGALYSTGGHIIIGIPPADQFTLQQ